MSVYHDEVEIEDFEYDEDEEIYYYPCPCGDRFQITKEELAAGEEVATCPSCSLIIKVIYDAVREVSNGRDTSEEYVSLRIRETNSVKKEMGGRGRGRAALSFNVEALGFGAGEALPGPQLQPPPAYPLLEHPAAPLYASPRAFECLKYKVDYLNEWSRLRLDLSEATTSSSVASAKRKPQPGLSEPSSSRPSLFQLDYNWAMFPPELRPMKPAKKTKKVARPAAPRAPNIDDLFSVLEKAESSSAQVKTEMEETEDQQGSDAEQDQEGQADEGYEDSDQEMDDGTDYNQNYFDNGDNYLDEDDDDDGPIY